MTNSTLINLKNPWILEDKYRAVSPIRDSTNERCYFLPVEMSLQEIIKSINISGFKIHNSDLANFKIKNYLNGSDLEQSLTLRDVLNGQNYPYLKL